MLCSRDEKPTARKEHKCCECKRTIKKGEKYSYFFGVWYEDGYGKFTGAYKTCLECEKDWCKILGVFHERGEDEANIVFGMLKDAIQDAFDERFLTKNDELVEKWLDIESEVDSESLSPEEKEDYERKEAVAQMRMCSHPLL